VKAAVGIDFSAGLEFGDNLRNQYAVVNKSESGEGFLEQSDTSKRVPD
jgi:hypothetical protein